MNSPAAADHARMSAFDRRLLDLLGAMRASIKTYKEMVHHFEASNVVSFQGELASREFESLVEEQRYMIRLITKQLHTNALHIAQLPASHNVTQLSEVRMERLIAHTEDNERLKAALCDELLWILDRWSAQSNHKSSSASTPTPPMAPIHDPFVIQSPEQPLGNPVAD
jgi:hypothetical protein